MRARYLRHGATAPQAAALATELRRASAALGQSAPDLDGATAGIRAALTLRVRRRFPSSYISAVLLAPHIDTLCDVSNRLTPRRAATAKRRIDGLIAGVDAELIWLRDAYLDSLLD